MNATPETKAQLLDQAHSILATQYYADRDVNNPHALKYPTSADILKLAAELLAFTEK